MTAAIIGLMSLVALALPILTGSASATLAGSSFDGTDAKLDAGVTTVSDLAASDTTYYGTGAKEDQTCPAFSSSAPAKGEIDHVYVGTQTTNTAVFLYLGWDRSDSNGTVTYDFELNQSKDTVQSKDPTCANPFQKVRTPGDILFTFDLLGSAPYNTSDIVISYQTWNGTAWVNPTIVLNGVNTANAEASVEPTGGKFGETVLNLVGLKILDPTLCQDFASFFAKTRASSSMNAELKDFTDPNAGTINLSNCRTVVPHKVDGNGHNLANAGFTLFVDDAPTGGTYNPALDTTVAGTCTTDSTGTCSIINVKGGEYWIVETTTPNGYTTANPVAQHLTVPTGGGADVHPANNFVNVVTPGTIKLTKIDATTKAALQGAQFGLFTDVSPFGGSPGAGDGTTSIATCTSDANGLCQFTQIDPGHYWAKETLTPAGYSTVSPIAVNLPLGSAPNVGATVDIGNVANNEVPGTIRLHKKDAQTGAALSGAHFELFNDVAPLGGAVGAGDTTTGKTCTSDGAGLCEFTGVAPGDYLAVETTTPNGYQTVDNVSVDVPLGSAANQGTIVNVDVRDNEVPGTINVHKIDAQTGDPVLGAGFTLFTDNAPVGGQLGPEDVATNLTCTTDANGDCSVKNVALGDYFMVETTTPNGYQTADPQAVHVGLGAAPNTGDVDNLTFPNVEVPGTINVHKVDADSNAALAGAEFTLFVDNAPIGNVRDNGDTSTGLTCTTDASGNCSFTTVALGKYWVVETKAPTGYAAAPDQPVGIKLGSAPNTGDTENLQFADPRLASSIGLVKTVNGNSSTSSGSPLQVEKGSTLTYTVTVTNTGQVALTVGSLTDTLKADLPSSCTQGLNSSLAAGASFTCTYTSTAAVPAGGGLVVNTAAVGATDQFGRNVQASDSRHVQVLDPVVNIVKTGSNGAHVGDNALYTLTVTNPGNTPLSGITVSDPKCDTAPALQSKTGGNQDANLDAGETWTFTCSHTVTQADGSSIVNTAKVTGADVLGTSVTADSSHTTPVLHPAININKVPSVQSANPGDPITYTYTVNNTGDTPLANVTVTDDKCSPVSFVAGDTNSDGKLDTGESWAYTCTNPLSSNVADQTNIGTASGTDVLGTKVTAQASATVTAVLAEVITRPTLPFTGAQVMRMLAVAATLLLIGASLVITTRRRRTTEQ